jgi:hypothetical protein
VTAHVLKPADDPSHENNSPKYHTGNPCVEKGCERPAGTAWSPYWCQPCNAIRMKRISTHLNEAMDYFQKKVEEEKQ